MITLPYELTTLYTLLIGAVITDLRSRRVPNALNAVLALGGLGAQVMTLGLDGLWVSALGLGMALALLIVPFALYVYRGGDVKLCMGVGAWLGWEPTLWVVAYGVLIGGALGLLQLGAARAGLWRVEQGASQTVPMALAFALATLLVTQDL